MKFITRFLAFIVAVLFILLLPLSLLSFNVGRVVYDRTLFKTVLSDAVTESQLIPSALAWFSEEVSTGLPLVQATQDDLSAVLISLTEAGWQGIRAEVLSDEILTGWVSSSVDDFYDWIDSNDPVPRIVLDMRPFKARINSDFGFRALEIAYNALPSCDSVQIAEFEALIEAAVPGTDVYYPPCQFPTLYRDEQLTDYLNSLVEVVAVIPDTFEITSQPETVETQAQSEQGWMQIKNGLRLLRSTYWLGLVVSFLLLALIGILVIRSARSLARWGGIPLSLAGILAILLSWLPGVLMAGFLLSGPLQETSPLLREEILEVVSRIMEEIFSPMMIQGLVLLLIGGFMVVFIGGLMGKQPARKPREEVP